MALNNRINCNKIEVFSAVLKLKQLLKLYYGICIVYLALYLK